MTWKGEIIGKKYRDGIGDAHAFRKLVDGQKSFRHFMGVLIQNGIYELHEAALVPEWQSPNDRRDGIKISDLLRISSGLRFRAPQDPDFDPDQGYPDHLYVYTNGLNTFQFAANLTQQWLPNTVGRYRNCDPVLINYLIRLGVESRGIDYQSFPQRSLFDKIGIRDMVIASDSYRNFLLQGYDFGTARDWARLSNLYLQDGLWNGERLLQKGYADFVSTLAPAWKADGRPIYGGFFWINGDESLPIPKESYFMAGAGHQMTIIIPSHDLVVVRLGHYRGASEGSKDLKWSLSLLMDAIPESH